jgi:hypothetical protein
MATNRAVTTPVTGSGVPMDWAETTGAELACAANAAEKVCASSTLWLVSVGL